MKTTRKELVEEFKKSHPIHDCLGSIGGRWKWLRYLDGIDLRYGHSKRQSAVYYRAKAAEEWAAMTMFYDEKIPCPECNDSATRREIEAMGGVCCQCDERAHPMWY